MSTPIREAARAIRELRQKRGEAAVRAALSRLPATDLAILERCWHLHARAKQLRPVNCLPWWVLQWGRGAGKSRSAGEHTLDTMEDWGPKFRGVLGSKTIKDLRRDMIRGTLLPAAERRGYQLRYVTSDAKVYHPNGATLDLISAEAPESGRGPNWNYGWFDEVAAWGRDAATFFKVSLLAIREKAPTPSGKPIGVITTTPRPNEIMMYILRDEAMRKHCTITRAHTLENAAHIEHEMYTALFGGTRLGRQELDGELLDSIGALVTQDVIHANRRATLSDHVDRRIVSVDPSITATDRSDDAGLVVVGCDRGQDDPNGRPHAYVLEDATMSEAHVTMWARRAVELAITWNAEAIVVEVNQGGDGIRFLLETAMADIGREYEREILFPIVEVWAKESKSARATPVGALYEHGRIHHVGVPARYAPLEKELTSWIPGMDSPNRMDALVHGVRHLIFGEAPIPFYDW